MYVCYQIITEIIWKSVCLFSERLPFNYICILLTPYILFKSKNINKKYICKELNKKLTKICSLTVVLSKLSNCFNILCELVTIHTTRTEFDKSAGLRALPVCTPCANGFITVCSLHKLQTRILIIFLLIHFSLNVSETDQPKNERI